MPSWTHPCRAKKGELVAVHDADQCPLCKQLGRGGVEGPAHTCENGVSKDSSTCAKCPPAPTSEPR